LLIKGLAATPLGDGAAAPVADPAEEANNLKPGRERAVVSSLRSIQQRKREGCNFLILVKYAP
jgi:hypothetical protein